MDTIPKYPGDEYADERLSKRLMDCLTMYKEQKEDALNFLDAFPRVPVDRWTYSHLVASNNNNQYTEELIHGNLQNFALAIPVTREKCIDLIGVSNVTSVPSFNDGMRELKTLDDVENKFTGNFVDVIVEGQKSEYANLLMNECPFATIKPDIEWEIRKFGNYQSEEFNSDPIGDILDWRNAFINRINAPANRALMTEDIFDFLCFKSNITDANHEKKRKNLAGFLSLENIYTISSEINIKEIIYPRIFFIYHSSDYVDPAVIKFFLNDFYCADIVHKTDARIMKFKEPNRRANILASDMIFSLQSINSNSGLLYRPNYVS